MAGALHLAPLNCASLRSSLASPLVANSRVQLRPWPPTRGERETSLRAIRIDRVNKRKEEDAIQSEEDLEICPTECVREIRSEKEFDFIVGYGASRGVLIVIDFFRTACGSCKYIEQGFMRICRAEGDEQVPVMFFKHNVMDDREEMSDIADRLRIKSVPLFHFYKGGQLVEAFSTRDKQRILDTINKHLDGDVYDYVKET